MDIILESLLNFQFVDFVVDIYIIHKNLKQRKSVLCSLGIMERMLQSTEGSTDSYRQVGDKIWPVYAHYEYEEEQKLVCCIKEWQQGALDYIDKRKII